MGSEARVGVCTTCGGSLDGRYRALCKPCYTKAWRARNPDYARVAMADWRKAHPELVRQAEARRPRDVRVARGKVGGGAFRARRLGCATGLTVRQWLQMLVDTTGCAYCGAVPDTYELEHKTPLSRGGSHTLENVVAACAPCNADKAHLTEGEYRVVLAYRAASL